jgi:SAM-dependent methyltransferase
VGHPGEELILDEVHAFVSPALGAARRVLEVGCGHGVLAARLLTDGRQITPLDRAPGCALPGFVQADFLRWTPPAPYDAVLFTSSLHHLALLDEAIDRARGALAPGGVLIVDEFDLDAPDVATLRWYYDDGFHLQKRWQEDHEHHGVRLHRGDEMRAAIAARFTIVDERRGPYLYRHLGHDLPRAAAERVLAEERAGIAAGALRPVGLRWVATRG